MAQDNRYEIEYYRWSTILVVLSLDIATPYITRMGLAMPADYQSELRRLMEADLHNAAGPDFAASVTEHFLEWIAQSYGRVYAHNLYTWGVQVFECGVMNYSMALWWDIAGSSARETSVSTPQFILRLREVLSAYPDEDVYRISPVSDWDKRIYKHQEYDNLMSAMELVQATIDRFAFRRAWSTVRDSFPNLYDVAAIKAWGIQTATLTKIPVARLGDPGSWPDLPALL